MGRLDQVMERVRNSFVGECKIEVTIADTKTNREGELAYQEGHFAYQLHNFFRMRLRQIVEPPEEWSSKDLCELLRGLDEIKTHLSGYRQRVQERYDELLLEEIIESRVEEALRDAN